HLISGHIEAEVPPKATGFTVETANGTVRDISTKFSVEVHPDRTEASVSKGKIEVYFDKGSTKLLVEENQTVELLADTKTIKKIAFEKRATVAGFGGTGSVISINFGNMSKVTGECGHVLAANWNNIEKTENYWSIINDQGVKTPLVLHLSDKNTFHSAEVVETKTDIQRLFRRRLNIGTVLPGEESPKHKLEISLKNIPYKKYDIIVYYWMGRRHDNHIFDLQINHGEKYRIHRPTTNGTDSENKFTHWKGVGRDLSGNMLITRNLTGNTANITASLPNNKSFPRSWYICGLQIVERW
ncbi:MAG: FecR domain-containing protein, partial [Lentisphaeraceae bacterium]|nr:FecR domain-containing protein [Lentisphaeraceae bacterium]